MSDPTYAIQAGIWLVATGWALGVGRGSAFVAAILLIFQLLIEYISWRLSRGVSFRPEAYLTDGLIMVFFILVAWRERSRWAAAAAGAQLMSIALHTVRPMMPHIRTWAFVTALDIFGFIVLAAVMIGAWDSRERPRGC